MSESFHFIMFPVNDVIIEFLYDFNGFLLMCVFGDSLEKSGQPPSGLRNRNPRVLMRGQIIQLLATVSLTKIS